MNYTDGYKDIVDLVERSIVNFDFKNSFKRYKFNGTKSVIIENSTQNIERVTNQISISMPISDGSSRIGVDVSGSIISMICAEFRQSAIKSISKYIFNNALSLGIDCIKYNSDELKVSEIIIDYLISMNSKNIIVNNRIASNILDSQRFNPLPISQVLNNNTFYDIGKVGDAIVYVDAYMKYTDNYMLTYDHCGIDWDNILVEVVSDNFGNIIPRMRVKYDFSFFVTNPKLIYVFTEDYMNGYDIFKSDRRDKKIDDILQ